jgi:hypothetical protein
LPSAGESANYADIEDGAKGTMMRGLLSIVLIVASFSGAASADDYVPGMNCDQVGDFAETVVREKGMGDTLQEQIDGMRQSISGYRSTQHALEKIIRAIYKQPELRAASPEAVNLAYKRACNLVSK